METAGSQGEKMGEEKKIEKLIFQISIFVINHHSFHSF